MPAPRTVQQLFDLRGRAALVTGGSRGLGLQIAHALGEAGARIVISARKSGELEQAAAELRRADIDAQWLVTDASDVAQCEALAATAIERLGQVDILVNNAGTTWGAAAEDYPLEAWDKVMNVNVRGVFALTRAIGKLGMIPRASGRILNIASLAALGGFAPMRAVGYNASKGAVVSLTRALAVEWGPLGITVNAIAPGVFPSQMSKALVAGGGGERLAQAMPLRCIGDDEALKGAALLLTSDAGKHITGQVLPVDGGATAMVG